MCRMIAAVGKVDMRPLLRSLRAMAANENPAEMHELRHLGSELRHDCGWGVAFHREGELKRLRSRRSCLSDVSFLDLEALSTPLVILHARRNRDRSTIDELNSHPFLEIWQGRSWTFCHNGDVTDRSQLVGHNSLVPRGETDSELLFHHVLTRLDRDRVAESLSEAMSGIADYTCLNAFLAASDSLTYHARVPEGSPRSRYYGMWLGRGDGVAVVSSERVDGLGVLWKPVPSGTTESLSLQLRS